MDLEPNLPSPTRKRRPSLLAPARPAKKAPLAPLPTPSAEEREEPVKSTATPNLNLYIY
jgi:hypothetical protein